jgi:hypothetical protein
VEQQARERQATAMAMFQERCKKAGESIHRTVDSVEGVFLLKIRPKGLNYSDQFSLDDPYGSDFRGDDYIMSFLRGFYRNGGRARPNERLAYRYVEATDVNDNRPYRYTASWKEVERIASAMSGNAAGQHFRAMEFVLERAPATGPRPRYGVIYDDISTREERAYWIAGSSLRIIDLQTNEVIAERIGYMVDPHQGSRSGGRSPWLLAADHACPPFDARNGANYQPGQTERFVEKVLLPVKE